MKKILSVILAVLMIACLCCSFAACGSAETPSTEAPANDAASNDVPTEVTGKTYNVGVCQLMEHESLDQATRGFTDALKEAMAAAGATVNIDTQVAGDATLCPTVINTFTAKQVDLIMANATPALLAASNATTEIPILGTSVTDYESNYAAGIPANVSGTSDAVPFAEQAQMMIDTLGLVEGDVVGVLYCTNESNSLIQYEAVKALFEEKGIVVEAYTFSETTELQTVTTSMASNVKAVYIPSDNTVAANDTIVGSICTDMNIPVYTSYGGAICYASLSISYYDLGYETGKQAAQILLEGKSPADIEIATLTPTVVYNEELCTQLGIEVPET